jgi:type II secretory pathway component PulF
MSEPAAVRSRPIARTIALVLWTGLIGGAYATSALVIPRLTHSLQQVGAEAPALTQAAAALTSHWPMVLAAYLLGVVAIGTRLFDRVIGGVIVMLSLGLVTAAAALVYAIWVPFSQRPI